MVLGDFIGIPYVDKGCSMVGADCYGLARMITSEIYNKKMPPLNHDYESAFDFDEMAQAVTRTKQEYFKLDTAEEGCIVLLKVKGIECHIGTVISGNSFIHTLGGHDSCLERLDSAMWVKRIEGFYAWH